MSGLGRVGRCPSSPVRQTRYCGAGYLVWVSTRPENLPGRPHPCTNFFATYSSFGDACAAVDILWERGSRCYALSSEGAKFTCNAEELRLTLPLLSVEGANSTHGRHCKWISGMTRG